MERDSRGALTAIINQIPETMPVSRQVLGSLFARAAERQRQDGTPGAERSTVDVGTLVTLVQAVIGLENRLEGIDGRPGFDPIVVSRLMSEFGLPSSGG